MDGVVNGIISKLVWVEMVHFSMGQDRLVWVT